MKMSASSAAPPRGERDDLSLRRLAEEAGCQVKGEGTMEILGHKWPFASLECGNNERAIRLLNLLAARDATHPRVRALGQELRAAYVSTGALLAAVQRFVKVSVALVREMRETFQHTLLTLHRRAGDCDDHARTVAAIALAAGIEARVVGVPNRDGKVGHVAPLLFDGARWLWAETTVDAQLGEHPRAATQRLRVVRADIWADRRTSSAPLGESCMACATHGGCSCG
jgi:hypothetical protein